MKTFTQIGLACALAASFAAISIPSPAQEAPKGPVKNWTAPGHRIYAQVLSDEIMQKHPELISVTFHGVPPGMSKVYTMFAGSYPDRIGNPDDPEQEADMLARSPITKVDRIRTPLLVIQGANDVRVVQAESDNLVAALRARGVDVEYMVKEDEGHGFVNPDNVIDMFRAVDRFLAEHLGG